MNSSEITFNKIFSFNEKGLSQDRLSEIEATGKISSLKEGILKEVKETTWPVAFNEIMKKVGDLLNISVPDVMVTAWNKHRILRKYLDREKYPPDETILAPLSEHTIESEHHPFIEVLLNNKPVGKVEFNINIALTLRGIILKIQNGKIKEILTGDCEGSGRLEYEGLVLFERVTGPIPLPGSIDLGEGVPIAS